MKFNKWTVALAAAGLVNLGSVTHAEEASNAVMTSLSKTTLSGYVDTSVSIMEGSAVGPLHGRVAYQNTAKMDGFNLDVIGLTLEKPLDESDWASGYRVDALVGPDASLYSTTLAQASNEDSTGGPLSEVGTLGIKQAYVVTRAPIGNGLDLKLGVFDAIIGYEVFQNGANPNYSRSYAYNLEPFSHTGALASYQINDMISVSGGVANTSRSVINDRPSSVGAGGGSSSHLSYMGSVAFVAPESVGFLGGATLYAGFLDGLNGNSSTRPDTTNYYLGATLPTPIDGLALGLAYDHVEEAASIRSGVDADVFGAYVSYQATDKLALHGRIEYVSGDSGLYDYYGDDGSMNTAGLYTDWNQELLGLTATLDYNLWDNVISRLEARWDQQMDDNPDAFRSPGGATVGSTDDIFTLTMNVIYNF